ncbi:MAG: class II D-tagatose-bisphosphate aldolase, non-catalytic subunit [Bacteroidales bacterium]|jgi:tagatose-1,6-bisphosphate aldolase non-catalytic subunit AgaZ/GatZ|nr:class II D-tagatose-bisphosphate aldolase, non-catalytic subunit [Bacteroidales bacterium]
MEHYNDLPKVEKIMNRIEILKNKGMKPMTLLGVCPNSPSVIKAGFRAAKRNNAPILFVATLNQVDCDGGYTGMTQEDFIKVLKMEARKNDYDGPYVAAVDHGGPWLKDKQTIEKWSYEQAMKGVKKSFEAAVLAGYDMIHVDPTVDRTLSEGEKIKIETVADRTVELISYVEKFRRERDLPSISYEVGTEEVHGGLADEKTFDKFLVLLKSGLRKVGYEDVWPCYIVGKVGTDLDTAYFDKEVASELTARVKPYGSYIKGHYTDGVENPQDYPLCGMGAANVGPEFTISEYDAIAELEILEKRFYENNRVALPSKIAEVIEKLVVSSGRWKKWLHQNESGKDFYSLDPNRRNWLIKTGARYIWQQPETIAARGLLYDNLKDNGIDAETIVLSRIEHDIDKYYNAFNIVNLNDYLKD